MALKPDRTVIETNIDFFMNETASRGTIVSVSTVGSGIAQDQAAQLATLAAAPSGTRPLGVLLNDVVNLDLTRQRQNFHKDEVQQGAKVTLLQKGTVVTDRVYPGQTPTGGGWAYAGPSGFIATVDVIGGGDTLKIGVFQSTKDEDGYAKVAVNLP